MHMAGFSMKGRGSRLLRQHLDLAVKAADDAEVGLE